MADLLFCCEVGASRHIVSVGRFARYMLRMKTTCKQILLSESVHFNPGSAGVLQWQCEHESGTELHCTELETTYNKSDISETLAVHVARK